MVRWRVELTVTGISVAMTLAALLAVLVRNHGVFAYTLDAPYIHLALADQIGDGNYDINAGEAAAPSSTILYPFLLAVLSSA